MTEIIFFNLRTINLIRTKKCEILPNKEGAALTEPFYAQCLLQNKSENNDTNDDTHAKRDHKINEITVV